MASPACFIGFLISPLPSCPPAGHLSLSFLLLEIFFSLLEPKPFPHTHTVTREKIMCCLSDQIWLILVNIIISNSIPFPIQRSGCPFYLRLDKVFSCMDTPFSLSANGYLGPSHFWALVNRTTINMALWSTGLTSFIYMLRSSIVGSQGNSGCGFFENPPQYY